MRAGLDKDDNVLIVAVSLAVGIIPITAPHFYHAFPQTARIVLDSGISAGCVAAVLLNLVFRRRRAAEDTSRPMDAGEEIAAAH
ncbi:Uric acid permease PucJ [Streptomyces sp. MBT84]|nr:Uric acid permease PucJ [Streptomyces sp. MBT84]